MSEFVIYYITCSSLSEAEKIAQALVNQELVACANILPGMTSLYRWQGKLESAHEVVLLLKGLWRNKSHVFSQVKNLHSYSTPCIITLPITDGEHNYLQWIKGSIV